MELYEAEWGEKITTPALNNLSFKKHNAPQLLPLTTDLVKLRNYLTENVELLTKEVMKESNKENFRKLTEVSLARMIMFNKRRGTYFYLYQT